MPNRPMAPWMPTVLLVVLPSLYYFGLSSSLALGVLLGCLGLIVSAMPTTVLGASPSTLVWHRMRFGAIAALAASIVVLHTALVWVVSGIDSMRTLASWVLGLIFLSGVAVMAHRMAQSSAASVDRAMRWLFVTLLLVVVGAALGLSPPTPRALPKPMFPFTEPSHFALVFVPTLAYQAAAHDGWRRHAVIALGLIVGAWIENLTCLVGVVWVAIFLLRTWMALPMLLLMGAVLAQTDLTYYSERVLITEDSDNLSALVYLQGLQLAAEAWERSQGLGIGFQQLGLRGTDVAAADAIAALMDGEAVNVLDGGFTAAKLLAEFGVLGVATVMGYVWVLVRAVRRLRQPARRPQLLAAAFVFGYAVELFVRGAGYFTMTTLLALAGAWALLAEQGATDAGRSLPSAAASVGLLRP